MSARHIINQMNIRLNALPPNRALGRLVFQQHMVQIIVSLLAGRCAKRRMLTSK